MLSTVRAWTVIKTGILSCLILSIAVVALLCLVVILRFIIELIVYNKMNKFLSCLENPPCKGIVVDKYKFEKISGEVMYTLFLQENAEADYCMCVYVSKDVYETYNKGDIYSDFQEVVR